MYHSNSLVINFLQHVSVTAMQSAIAIVDWTACPSVCLSRAGSVLTQHQQGS